MKGSPRISYPLLFPIPPKNTAATILIVLCKLRGKKMWVERRHTTAIVRLVVRTTVTAGGWFLYPATTIVQGVSVLLSGKRDRHVHVRGGNRALRYVVPRPMTSKTPPPFVPLVQDYVVDPSPTNFSPVAGASVA